MNSFLVGGAVRDQLLNLPIKDRDWVVVGSNPQELLEQGFTQVGKDFPVFLHPETKEEYALARTERKIGSGHQGFSCYFAADVTLEDDLLRRDLTINAIAYKDGQYVDPFHGIDDLNNRLLRHVSPAFKEDPLRVLRVARFAARFASLGFEIHSDTMELMRDMVACGELESLTAERVWQEMERALLGPSPSTFFYTLRAVGALKVILPELDRLFGVPQTQLYHPEVDCGIHTLQALDRICELSALLETRFATLVHDLGKGTTPEAYLPGHRGHEQRGVGIIESLGERLRVPKSCIRLSTLVSRWHSHCHHLPELRPATIYKVLQGLDSFRRPETLEQFVLVCTADYRGRSGFAHSQYANADMLRQCFEAAQIDIKALKAQSDVLGAAFGELIHQNRINAIRDWQKLSL